MTVSFLQKMQRNFAASRYSCAGLDPLIRTLPSHLRRLHPSNELATCRQFLV